MTTSLAKLTLLAFSLATLSSASLTASAQTTNPPVAQKKSAAQPANSVKTETSAKGGPFHGKLAAVDKLAKTITVGKRTFRITSETRLKKAGKPATLEDAVIGEIVSGYIKPGGEGKLVATTVNLGPKPGAAGAPKTKTHPANEK